MILLIAVEGNTTLLTVVMGSWLVEMLAAQMVTAAQADNSCQQQFSCHCNKKKKSNQCMVYANNIICVLHVVIIISLG